MKTTDTAPKMNVDEIQNTMTTDDLPSFDNTGKRGRPRTHFIAKGVEFKKITYSSKIKKQSIDLYVGKDGTIVYNGRVLPLKVFRETGYAYAYLGPDTKVYGGMLPVHRLVCIAWHGEPRGRRTFVDHIDGNRINNDFKNLRWATRKENSRKRKRNSHNGLKNNAHASKIIQATDKEGKMRFFMNAYDAAKCIGCSHVLIYRVLNPNDWPQTAKGHMLEWREIKSGMTVRFETPEE